MTDSNESHSERKIHALEVMTLCGEMEALQKRFDVAVRLIQDVSSSLRREGESYLWDLYSPEVDVNMSWNIGKDGYDLLLSILPGAREV